jgi:phage-related tail protein
MNASVDTLAEQMLTLVDIVSAQEKDIKILKDQSRKLEERDQAIMVAFTTFFHVLAAGRVAKLSEISSILHNIIRIAEQEGRPQESIKFLQDLAAHLSEQSSVGARAGRPG